MTEAHVTVEVEVDPATAFDLFTRDIAAWWRADRSLWGDSEGELRFEDGRLMQGTAEIGHVSVWEPGPRLAFSYGPPGVDPTERTEVDVRFEAVRGGTRVVVRHGGWEKANWAGLLAGFARHSLERMLLARLGDFLDAIGRGDLDFFQRNLTDEAMLIFPGERNTYTKAQCVAAMAGHPVYHKVRPDRSTHRPHRRVDRGVHAPRHADARTGRTAAVGHGLDGARPERR
jgi:activator of Hsp90 ATPase-like protein